MATTRLAPRSSRRLELLRRVPGDEGGFSLLEMLIAIVILSIAILALVSVFTAAAISLHRSAQRGTAVTLAESQMEIYRTLSFTGIRIDGTLVPTSGTDPYVSGNSADANIPPSTGQALAGQNGDDACPSATLPAACLPVQTVTGPDSRSYTIDTYVDYVNNDATLSIRTPAAGLNLKRVTVVVRDPATNAVLARDSSAFHLT
jgi:prepilin-type N-terminal cleavage/methylation domain-containing protein